MKTIGILGGLGPESTTTYYQYITREYYERRHDYNYPPIIICSLCFQEFIDHEYLLPDKVHDAILRMNHAGADFIVAACNSLHLIYDGVSKNLPIPWISIIDATAERIQKAGIQKIGLLGTIFTMSRGFYAKGLERHGIETLVPDQTEQESINTIIYSQLVRNIVNEKSRDYVLRCIDRLAQQGAEGIVLGCTELPYLITEKDTSIRIFDTAKIHAYKALDISLGIQS